MSQSLSKLLILSGTLGYLSGGEGYSVLEIEMAWKTGEEREQSQAEKKRRKALVMENADLLTLLFLMMRAQGMCLAIGGFAAIICPWDTTNPANFWCLLVMGIFGFFWFYELFFGCE